MIMFARLQEVTTDEGPCKRLPDKNNASTMQKHIVPWLIAMYGLSYSKTVATNVVKQMIIALCEKHEYLDCRMTVQEAAAEYSLAYDAVQHVMHAAGMSLFAHPHLT
jgi:hypothetical protein